LRARLFCLLFSLVPAWAGSVPDRPVFDRYTREDGLSQASIFDIYQDSLGYLWLATQDGVNMFDGETFRVFRQIPFDETSMLGSWARFVFEQRDGTIWVATNDGLSALDRDRMRFRRFPLRARDRRFPPSFGLLTAMEEDRHGRLVVGSSTGRLMRLDPQSGVWVPFALPPSSPSSPFVTRLHRDRHGDLWATTLGAGLLRFDEERDAWEAFLDIEDAPINIGRPNGHFPSPTLLEVSRGLILATFERGLCLFDRERRAFVTLLPDSDTARLELQMIASRDGETIWAVAGEGRLARYDLETGVREIFDSETVPLLEGVAWVDLLVDRNGRPWLTTENHGLISYADGTFHVAGHRPGDPGSIPANPLRTLYEDRAGNLWIGGDGTGLAKLSPSRQKFQTYLQDHDLGQLAYSMVWTLLEDRKGRVWVGTHGRGLLVLGPDRRKIERHLTGYFGNPDGMQTNQVHALMEDHDGHIWIGTGGPSAYTQYPALFRYDPETDEMDPFWAPAMVIRIARASEDGRLFIGAGNGFNYLDESEGQVYRVTMKGVAQQPTLTWSFIEDEDGMIWVTSSNGLFHWNPSDERARHFTHDPDDRTGLSNDRALCVIRDSKGSLWVATLGGGVNRFHEETGVFTHLTTNEGLPSNAVYGLLEAEGRLWMSTNNGLASYDLTSGEVRAYSTSDGLQDNEFNSGAYYRSSSGELFFGGISGFSTFYPADLESAVPPPPMVVSATKNVDELVGRNLADGAEIRLDPGDRLVHFDFAALDFNDPARNRYRYRLEGFDPAWVDAGTERGVTYTNLDHGAYTFHVMGANSDMVWSEPRRVALVVAPAFYETIWFALALVVLTGSIIAWLLVSQRRRHARRQAAALRDRDLARKSEELAFARGIQLAMLPGNTFDHAGYEIAGRMETATEVGGDYYDFFVLPDGRLCIAYGDATGHGVAAGLVVGMVKMAATLWSRKPHLSATEMMGEINAALKVSLPAKGMGMALAFVLLDSRVGEIELISCGMPFPHIFRKERGMLQRLALKAPPLGYLSEIEPAYTRARLEREDLLIFLSDGFVERFNPRDEIWGVDALTGELERICKSAASAEDVAGLLIEACDSFADGRTNDDDMTAVIARYRGLPEPREMARANRETVLSAN